MADDTLSGPPRGGNIPPVWRLWFEQLWRRVGQGTAPSNDNLAQLVQDLTTRVAAMEATTAALEIAISVLETTVAIQGVQLSALEGRVSTLENTVAALESDFGRVLLTETPTWGDLARVQSRVEGLTVQTLFE